MRTTLILAVSLLLLCPAAQARQYQLYTGFFGAIQDPVIEEWDELYDGRTLDGASVRVDSALFHGVGPYLTYTNIATAGDIRGEIDLRHLVNQGAMGLSFHYPALHWLWPAVRAGALYFRADQSMRDGDLTIERTAWGFGFDADVGATFFPFFSFKYINGLGISTDFTYQTRALHNMGDLTGTTAWGVILGLDYRWDFGRDEPSLIAFAP